MRTLFLSLFFLLCSVPTFADDCGQEPQFVKLENALDQVSPRESLGDIVKTAVQRICSNDAAGKAQSLRSVTDLENYLQGVSPEILRGLEQVRIALTR